MRNLRMCPKCHLFSIDAGESDCGCVDAEKQQEEKWHSILIQCDSGQLQFNIEKEVYR